MAIINFKCDYLNKALNDKILPQKERNSITDGEMMSAKNAVVNQLEVVRKKADAVCNNDEILERQTGFAPTKTNRSRRTSIGEAVMLSASTTNVKGMIEITLLTTVYGNKGYEVHCVLNGVDSIAGVVSVRDRTMKMTCGNFPSLKPVEVYLITLGPNGLRSLPSNTLSATAL